MPLRYSGLRLENFAPLFGLGDHELAVRGIRRVVADAKPGFPCRITLADAEPGETLLLLAYEHHPAESPYRASGPIFVREAARETYDNDRFPPVFRGRLLSVRVYDAAGVMIDAEIVAGDQAEALFTSFFDRPDASYIHVHNARRGCYAGLVTRA